MSAPCYSRVPLRLITQPPLPSRPLHVRILHCAVFVTCVAPVPPLPTPAPVVYVPMITRCFSECLNGPQRTHRHALALPCLRHRAFNQNNPLLFSAGCARGVLCVCGDPPTPPPFPSPRPPFPTAGTLFLPSARFRCPHTSSPPLAQPPSPIPAVSSGHLPFSWRVPFTPRCVPQQSGDDSVQCVVCAGEGAARLLPPPARRVGTRWHHVAPLFPPSSSVVRPRPPQVLCSPAPPRAPCPYRVHTSLCAPELPAPKRPCV